jgi:hypothetical protein
MKIGPVKIYPQPSYPNEYEYKNDTGQGYPQISKTAALITILALAASDNYNSKTTAQDKPKVEQSDKSMDDSLSQIDKNRTATYVAPVFEHGDGRGAVGCEVIAPPVFISEEDARNIIIEMLAKHGIEFDMQDKDVDGIQFPTFDGRPIISYSLDDTVDKPIDWQTLNLDLFSSKYNLGIEYVSRTDHYALGGPFSDMSVKVYNLIKIANDALEKLSEYGKFNGAVFYDPMVLADWKHVDSSYWKLQRKISKLQTKQREKKLTEKERPKLEALFQQLAEERLKQPDYEKGREELRAQVRDFIAWLKDKGIIKE